MSLASRSVLAVTRGVDQSSMRTGARVHLTEDSERTLCGAKVGRLVAPTAHIEADCQNCLRVLGTAL